MSGARASGTRRRRLQGAELVESLNKMVSDLINENRRLKRQLERLVVKGGADASGSVERSLRSLQRRVQRAVSPVNSSRRRRSTSATGSRRRRRSGGQSAG